MNFTVVILRP